MSDLTVQSSSHPPSPESSPQPPANAAQTRSGWSWLDAFWRALVDSRLLVLLGLFLLAPMLLSIVLPQMPGQLHSEPLAADRWLTATAEAFGFWGALLRALGMFDVLHSPIFLIALWATIFVLLVQAANAVLVALQFWRLPMLLDESRNTGGEPLPVVMPRRVWRWRGAVLLSSIAISTACEANMQTWATRLERRMLRVPASPPQLDALEPATADAPTTILEERLLGMCGWIESALRPLLPVGMILALIVVAWYSITGHSFLPASLLPGERASDAALGVTVEYQLTYPQPGVIGPVLKVNKGETERTLPLDSSSVIIDGVVVNAQPGAPMLLVHTLDDAFLLARPGQSSSVAVVGLGFPNPGSEQVLVLPQYAVGMRVIRQDSGTPSAADDSFIVEVFQGDSEEPVQRFTVSSSEVKRVETAYGDIPLSFVPMAMFQVQAYTASGGWLLLPAAVLALAGAYGFRRRPAFLLAQFGPWPVDRSVVIIQTDRAAALEMLRGGIDAQGVQSGPDAPVGRSP